MVGESMIRSWVFIGIVASVLIALPLEVLSADPPSIEKDGFLYLDLEPDTGTMRFGR